MLGSRNRPPWFRRRLGRDRKVGSDYAIRCPPLEPADAAAAVPGAVAVAANLAGTIAIGAVAVLKAPGLAVVGPAVGARSVIPAVDPGSRRRHEPVADARDEYCAPRACGLRYLSDARGW